MGVKQIAEIITGVKKALENTVGGKPPSEKIGGVNCPTEIVTQV